MTAPTLHLDREYFVSQYATGDDPWGFDQRFFELRKFSLTVAALPRHRYRRALEPGCANGALTEQLAGRCDELVAFDLLEGPVDRARARVDALPHVTVEQAVFPTWWPDGDGDLVVLSEIAYYLTDDGADVAADGLEQWLEPGGTLVAVHWTGPTSYPRTGRSIGPWLDDLPFLDRTTTMQDEEFDLGVWRRRDDGGRR